MLIEPSPSLAVVVTSSSRSGSTWLANMLIYALQLQGVFEPLHPKFNGAVRLLTGFDPKQDHVSSFYLRSGDVHPEWDQLLAATLAGQLRNSWTDKAPTAPSPRGYLIKMIRANLMLGYLYDQFQPKLIYLVRHPCAVVNSRLHMRWTVSAQALLRQEELVEDFLHPWVATIERETHPVGVHALWWAVENMVAQHELSTRPHCHVFYEALMLDTNREIERIADFIGVEVDDIPQTVIEELSWTSRRAGSDALVAPLVSWQEDLSQEDQQRVLDWANRLGIRWYGPSAWPEERDLIVAEVQTCVS